MPATDETQTARKIAVIAGSYREFMYWCAEQNLSPYSPQVIYATPTSLRGRSNLKVERVGGWAGRKDLREIEEALRFVNRFG